MSIEKYINKKHNEPEAVKIGVTSLQTLYKMLQSDIALNSDSAVEIIPEAGILKLFQMLKLFEAACNL